MSGFEGTLARKLDFGNVPPTVTSTVGRGRAELRLTRFMPPSPPDKYRVLEQRRRAAQMRARHLLERGEFEV